MSKKNPFEVHDIRGLSPSSLNSYNVSPALWIMERLFKQRAPVGAAAHRGTATEAGVHEGLMDPEKSIESCIEIGLAKFDSLMALSNDPKKEKERKALPGYITNGIVGLRPYGKPSHYQERIEIRVEGIPLPISGYVDWMFEDHGILMDLKTSTKHPKTISTAHGRQVSIYHEQHGNFDVRLAYVKPIQDSAAATSVLPVNADLMRYHIEALKHIAWRLQNFLALSDDKEVLASLVVPDYDHFFWGSKVARDMGHKLYGF